MKLHIATEQQTKEEQEQEKSKEQLNTQSFALETENKEDFGNKILDRIPITGTPFHVVRTNENLEESFIAVGNNRISEIESEIELTERIENKDWNLITSLIICITDKVMQAIKEEDKARNESIKEKEVTDI